MVARPTLGFVGAGTVGTALAWCLAENGYQVVGVHSRSAASAQHLAEQVPGAGVFPTAQALADAVQLVLITSPDEAIPSVAGAVAWRMGQMVVHCSGADSADILEPARQRGACVGVFHPLQSFASPTQAGENLAGSTFALEGDSPLVEILEDMADALGGRSIRLRPGQKVLYHAAAVMASNYLVTLAGVASRLWREFGIDDEQAVAALLPLMRGTLNNIEQLGIAQSLTGPIARGDVNTVRKHLGALALQAPDVLTVYQELASQTLPIAEAKGKLAPEKAQELRCLLAEAAAAFQGEQACR